MESKTLKWLKKCCVIGCQDKRSVRHRFPLSDKNLFEKWLNIINPPNWKNLTLEQINKKYFVCHSHFDSKYFLPGARRGLTVDAVPTIGIPGTSQPNIDIPSSMILENTGSAHTEMHNILRVDAGRLISVESLPGPSKPTPMSSATESIWEGKRKVGGVVKGQKSYILKHVNVTRSKHLRPREKLLYNSLKKSLLSFSLTKKKFNTFKQRLAMAEKVSQGRSFQGLLKHVNVATYNFVMCQVRNQSKNPCGRRYTLEEKILALALYKSSPKGYKLLCKLFSLPKSKTLRVLLHRLPFYPGINAHIFEHLKNSTMKMKMQETFCVLVFDEISLETNLTYEKGIDEIVGLEDYGNEKKTLLANYANVFMIKGIYRQWKQPVAFTFSKGPIKAVKLKILITDLIQKCQEIGLQVISTICDQGPGNQAAINMLLEEKRQYCIKNNIADEVFGFLVGDEEIVPLYDIPHLFKGLRNNLLTKSLKFSQNGVVKIAKWNHIEQFYQLDSSEPNLRICSKLTDAHVIPAKINKMKVKMCTQIFSHTVGSLMKRIAQWDIKDRFNLPNEAVDTADLILFLDKLFDSLNVSRKSKPEAKSLKCAVTSKSPHKEFWYSALELLNTMTFHCPIKGKDVNVPTLKNLKFTLRGIIYIVNNLIVHRELRYVLTAIQIAKRMQQLNA